jgi:hypothetical protein
MQVRGLLIGALLLALLGGGVWWSQRQETEKGAAGASDDKKLFKLKDEEVNRIEIVRADGTATILEKDKAGWRITAPQSLRVDNDAVTSLVSSFTGLTETRVVEEKGADLQSFGLGQPAVKVTVNGKHTLLIGDDTPTGGNTFAKLASDPKVFTIGSFNKTSLDKTWRDLQDKRLLTVDENKLTRVELAAKGSTLEFGKNAQGEWQILKPRPLRADNGAVEEMVRKLREAKMDTSADPDPAKFASGTRVAVATLTDASGTQTLEIRKSGEDYYAKSSVVEGAHKVTGELGEGVNKTLEDFRNKKLFDFGFNEPSKVVIRAGAQSWNFTKGGEKWWSNGKEMDAASVQQVIDRLRDLTATAFVDAAPAGAPVLEIAVTSSDGKRTETVQAFRSGADFVAKRENEPSVYKLEANAVPEIEKAAAEVKPPPPPTASAPPGAAK